MQAQNLQTLADWSHGRLLKASPALVATGISTDSRAVRSGELFVALSGDKFDGHDFLVDVCAKGAVAARSRSFNSAPNMTPASSKWEPIIPENSDP